MKISVIIPTLNEGLFIEKTLRQIRENAGDQVCEIIVADGGSEDDTVQIAERAGAVVLRSPIQGRAAQMNFGARASRGQALHFVHADTLVPDTFATDITAALASGDCEMGNFPYRFDNDSALLRFNASFTHLPWLFCQGGDKTLFMLKSVFDQLGGYDEEHVAMEEYDFLRRAMKAGFRLRTLPALCVVSARKYEHNSWLRVQIANIVVFNAWAWGLAKPKRLKELYRGILR